MTPSSLTVWRFCDGNRGHEKQSQALLQGLSRHARINQHDIIVTETAVERWLQRLLERPRHCQHLPAPDLIVGAGHRTHLPMLTAQRTHGGKTVVLMKPSLPLHWFDSAIIPEHDRPDERNNVLVSRTVLAPSLNNRPDPQRGLILVGGDNRHFHWSDNELRQHIEQLVKSTPQIQWQLTNSRRTPASFQAPSINNLRVCDYRSLDPSWLTQELSRAGHVCITIDSASMLAEALNSKAQITLLPLASKKNHNKLQWGAERLQRQGLVSIFENGNTLSTLATTPLTIGLDEHLRCARQLLDLFFGTNVEHAATTMPSTANARA